MASWEEVQKFIEKEFSAEKVDNDFWKAVFPLGDNRSQVVAFRKKIDSDSNTVWLDIQSPIGKFSTKEKLDKALDLLAVVNCGGLIKFGDVYCVRHGIPIDDLSADEIRSPLFSVCVSADYLEKELVGGDNW